MENVISAILLHQSSAADVISQRPDIRDSVLPCIATVLFPQNFMLKVKGLSFCLIFPNYSENSRSELSLHPDIFIGLSSEIFGNCPKICKRTCFLRFLTNVNQKTPPEWEFKQMKTKHVFTGRNGVLESLRVTRPGVWKLLHALWQ